MTPGIEPELPRADPREAVCAGWDIGGSHLKLALCDERGRCQGAWQFPLPLWRGLEILGKVLGQAVRRLPKRPLKHALTLTAELCDIFQDRERGVRTLLDILRQRLGEEIRIYSLRGFLGPREARDRTRWVASANWHATLRYATARLPAGILLDIGGTTTDILPFAAGKTLHQGRNDAERMLHGELVYSGVIRTTLAAVARQLPVAGSWLPVAAEHFASMADVYRLSKALPKQADILPTCDGAPVNATACARRLARLCGQDLKAGRPELQKWRVAASYAAELQVQQLYANLARLLSRPALQAPLRTAPLVATGAGAFLVPRLAQRCDRPVRKLFAPPEHAEPELAQICASALAVAVLAVEEGG